MVNASTAALLALARQRQGELDEAIGAWRGGPGAGVRLWCAPGCGNCCTLAVNTTFPEALAIAADLDPDQHRSLAASVERIVTHAQGSQESVRLFLTGYREAVGACPFLTADDRCGIHPRRPLACRALLATRPPQWCGVNLATLPGIERNSFLESLDRAVVAWPTHYAAAPQEAAASLEQGLVFAMLRTHGFGITGSLPLLVWLAGQAKFAAGIDTGPAALRALLGEQGLLLPFLVQVHEP